MMKRMEGNACKWEARHRTIVRASCFAALVLFVLLAPSVSALTILPEGGGMTWTDDSPPCLAMVAVPPPDDINIADYETVRVPMRAEWDDDRTSGGPYLNLYVIDPWYQSVDYQASYPKYVWPNSEDSYNLFATVPNVMEDTYMTIYYSAYVYDGQSNLICSDSGWTYFYFE